MYVFDVAGFGCWSRLFADGGIVDAGLLVATSGICWNGLFVAGGTNVDVTDVFGCREDVVVVGGTLEGGRVCGMRCVVCVDDVLLIGSVVEVWED